MKILLSGPPKVGKSTILQKFRENYKGRKYGIISQEIKDDKGNRVGFAAVNENGKSKVFAHKFKIKSKYVVAGKYYVDVKSVDAFVIPEIERGLKDMNSLVFIDEIGRMQFFSKKFLDVVSKILDSDTNVLATIVSDPEPWSLDIKNHPRAVLVEITKQNRNKLPKALLEMFNNTAEFRKLTKAKKELVLDMLRNYFQADKFIQIEKLFKNTLNYVNNAKVSQIEKGTIYEVEGFTKKHLVKISKANLICDCDLFSGRGKYSGEQGECSHIQAVRLFLA